MRRSRSWSSSAVTPMGELNIVPFLDIVVNVIMYLLALLAVVLATVQVDSNARGFGPRPVREPLGLTVVVGATGIHLATAAGTIAAGCRTVARDARSTAVARADWPGLERCARTLKAANPDEESVVLSADPEVPYEDVVAAMDALRPSFPDVQIAAGLR